MKIKGKIKEDNSFEMNTPVDDHSHCHRTLDGKHRFIHGIGMETRPFLYFFQIRRAKYKTTTCLACGILAEVQDGN